MIGVDVVMVDFQLQLINQKAKRKVAEWGIKARNAESRMTRKEDPVLRVLVGC